VRRIEPRDDLLGRQAAALTAENGPMVSAFGRTGYGRPGLNPLATEFEGYWLAGVQVEWRPWDRGTTRRRREALSIQQQIVATEEDAFTERLRRGVVASLAEIDRLEHTRAADDEIVGLRERILGETRARFSEGVITSAEFVDRETEALTARLARATHSVQLSQARAQLLTLVGLEVR
jgi:outer membrane protein TolC